MTTTPPIHEASPNPAEPPRGIGWRGITLIALLPCSALISPLLLLPALIVMWSGPVYFRQRHTFTSSAVAAMGIRAKVIASCIFAGFLYLPASRLFDEYQKSQFGCANAKVLDLAKEYLAKNVLQDERAKSRFENIRTGEKWRGNGLVCRATAMIEKNTSAISGEQPVVYTIEQTDDGTAFYLRLTIE